MKAEKRPTEMQLLALNIIIEKGLGPITKEAPSPTSCRPISPSRLPPSTPPYLSIESFFMLQATKEAPPKIAAVRPRQVGTIVGLIALAIAMAGAPPTPKPTTPNPNMALRRGVLMGFKNQIFSLALSFSVSTKYLGCMQLVATKPTIAAKDPPRDRGHIMLQKAGMDITAYEEARAPPKASPVVVYTVDKNLFTPTFLEIASLVVSPEVAAVSYGLSLAKQVRLRADVRRPNEVFLAIVLNAPIIIMVIIIEFLEQESRQRSSIYTNGHYDWLAQSILKLYDPKRGNGTGTNKAPLFAFLCQIAQSPNYLILIKLVQS